MVLLQVDIFFFIFFFFFFKQKTAYEISACLVGSEMCIRDRYRVRRICAAAFYVFRRRIQTRAVLHPDRRRANTALPPASWIHNVLLWFPFSFLPSAFSDALRSGSAPDRPFCPRSSGGCATFWAAVRAQEAPARQTPRGRPMSSPGSTARRHSARSCG